MKKIFSLIALASLMLTSVFSFSSCTNDDSDYNRATKQQTTVQTQTKSEAHDLYLYVPACKDQLKYIDVTYTLQIDGTQKTVKMSEMTQVEAIKGNSASHVSAALTSLDGKQVEVSFYRYSIGNAKSARVLSVTYTVLLGSADHNIALATGYGIYEKINNDDLRLLSESAMSIIPGFTDVKEMVDIQNGK